MRPGAEEIDAVRDELQRIYQTEGQVVFWPSVLKAFGDSDTVADILLHLFGDGFLYVSVDISCPQGHDVVVGADVKSRGELDKLLSEYSSRSCTICNCGRTLGEMDPRECDFEIVYYLADWVQAKKKVNPTHTLNELSDVRDAPFEQQVNQKFFNKLMANKMYVYFDAGNEMSKEKKEDNQTSSTTITVGDGANLNTGSGIQLGVVGVEKKNDPPPPREDHTVEEGEKNRKNNTTVAWIAGCFGLGAAALGVVGLILAAFIGLWKFNESKTSPQNTSSVQSTSPPVDRITPPSD